MPTEPDADGRTSARGVVIRIVPLEFEETVARLVAAIEGRGLRLFDVIDHREAARAAGLELRPTRVLVFGSPVAGTPLMDRSPSSPSSCRCGSWSGGAMTSACGSATWTPPGWRTSSASIPGRRGRWARRRR